jgi:Type II CAAX prenyl endopeptidase Rce1-like
MKKFFLITNSDDYPTNDSFLLKTRNLVLSFLFMWLLVLVALAIAASLDYCIVNYFHFESILNSISKTQSKYDALLLLVIVIVPFFEELLFRLVLKVNKLHLSIFTSLLSYTLVGGKILRFDIHNNYSLAYLFFGLLVGVVTYLFVNQKSIDFLNQKRKWLVVISIVLFGLGHINNIKVYHWELTLLYPFFVMPQFILGYLATNLRLKYGFVWGFLLHAMINGSPYLLPLLHH